MTKIYKILDVHEDDYIYGAQILRKDLVGKYVKIGELRDVEGGWQSCNFWWHDENPNRIGYQKYFTKVKVRLMDDLDLALGI